MNKSKLVSLRDTRRGDSRHGGIILILISIVIIIIIIRISRFGFFGGFRVFEFGTNLIIITSLCGEMWTS